MHVYTTGFTINNAEFYINNAFMHSCGPYKFSVQTNREVCRQYCQLLFSVETRYVFCETEQKLYWPAGIFSGDTLCFL
jgi:hypothetical protein